MNNKNPLMPIIILAFFIFGLICYIGISQYINETRGFIASPQWINVARVVVYFVFICCFACAFLMERHVLRTESAERIIKQRKDPNLIILIYGLGLFILPTCIMFFLFLKSGFINDIYICSLLSFIGFIFWSWHKRNTFNLSHHTESQEQSMEIHLSISPDLTFVRAYSVILSILSIIYAGFLFLKIFFIINPPEFRTAHNPSLEIIMIPVYAFLAICCFTTAALRFRKSPYALFATKALSILLIVWLPFGTAASVYWFGWVRKKEKPNN